MSEEKPRFQKMKFVGFTCIGFAALLTLMVVFGFTEVERVQATISLIGTWLLTGTGLLATNAAKRIGGHVVANRAPQQISGK